MVTRSRKERLAQLRARLRGEGWSYGQIATHIRDHDRVNIRLAFRQAHGMTQQQVADRWNALWPDSGSPKTAKQISYWEAWPAPSGRTPSLEALGKLAYIYGCRPGDLLDTGDYACLDWPGAATSGEPPPSAVPERPTARAAASAEPGPSTLLPAPDDCFPSTPVPLDGLPTQLASCLGDLASVTDQGQALSARQRDAAFRKLIDSLIGWAHTMNRRALLRHLSWAAATAAAAPILDGLPEDHRERFAAVLQQPRRIDHAVAAQAWANQTDDMPLRAYAADVAARAYAMDQQSGPCLRHLDAARACVDATADEPTLVHFYNRQLLDSIHGLCLLNLNQPVKAVEHARNSLSTLDPTYVRNVAFNTVYLGMGQLALGEIDAAADSLGDAAALTVHNRSARLVERIRDGRREFAPWADTRAVCQLDERLRTYDFV